MWLESGHKSHHLWTSSGNASKEKFFFLGYCDAVMSGGKLSFFSLVERSFWEYIIQKKAKSRHGERKGLGAIIGAPGPSSTWCRLHTSFHLYQQVCSLFPLNQPESVFCHEIKSWLITLSGKTVTAALYHPSQQFFFFCLLSFLYANHANSFLSGFAHLLHQSEMPSESLPHCPFTAHPNSQSQEALLTL